MNSVITNFNGDELKGKDGEEITLKKVCVDALLAEVVNEQTSGNVRMERFKLAKKIHDSDMINLTVEELSMIKERIPKTWNTLVTGMAFQLIEQDE